MNKENINYISNAFGLVLSAIQTESVFQIISFILTILATLLSIAYTIYKWYLKATKDGKIDAEDIKELTDVLNDEKDKYKGK